MFVHLALQLHSPVNQIKGVGDKYLQIFNKSGISTVFDLLLHFPVLYIDFSQAGGSVETGVKKLYRLEVINANLSRHFGRRLSILKVNALVGTDKVQVVFFNKHYLADFFKEHKQAYIYGTFEMRDKICQANTPLVFSLTDPEREPTIPLYNKIGAMKSGILKKIIGNALQELRDSFEPLPRQIREKYAFPGIVESLKTIHFPGAHEPYEPGQVQKMKQRFIYSEFLLFQLELQYIRNFFTKVPRIHRYKIDQNLKTVLKELLPFNLTPDQKTACREMTADLEKDVAMQRLLQGDVGTGKTAVAFIALLTAATSGFQGAFLAPTEILAQQHFMNAQKFFNPLNAKGGAVITCDILTGSTPAKERERIRRQLLDGTIHIVFGTHALLNESIGFQNLAMVIIDEQHRFGVSQRAALYYKGKAVDLLVTTATPIPRTMLLSLYNDLAVSIIKTKPRGRLPIITKIMDINRRDEFYQWLRKKITEGEKAYIILPLIEDSEFFTELRSIESEAGYFKDIFTDIPMGIISGRLSPVEKDSAIEDFASGKSRVLVSTTVIEVGIDVSDATIMVIENADRYGLSQLHQLRGRVGRGERQSQCFLFASANITESGQQRLQTIAATEDGFKIAEIDLKMRGGGIISGLEQSGYLDFKVGDMRDDHEIFNDSRTDAAEILADPELQNEYLKNFLAGIKGKLKEINFS